MPPSGSLTPLRHQLEGPSEHGASSSDIDEGSLFFSSSSEDEGSSDEDDGHVAVYQDADEGHEGDNEEDESEESSLRSIKEPTSSSSGPSIFGKRRREDWEFSDEDCSPRPLKHWKEEEDMQSEDEEDTSDEESETEEDDDSSSGEEPEEEDYSSVDMDGYEADDDDEEPGASSHDSTPGRRAAMSAFCLDLQTSAVVSAPLELDSDCMESRASPAAQEPGGFQALPLRQTGSGGLGMALEEELAMLTGERDDEDELSDLETSAVVHNADLLSLFRQKEKDLV
ncbi:BICD family-like cargo adapter 1, partial [Nibea albiflora]